jgi:hypothetical protein
MVMVARLFFFLQVCELSTKSDLLQVKIVKTTANN